MSSRTPGSYLWPRAVPVSAQDSDEEVFSARPLRSWACYGQVVEHYVRGCRYLDLDNRQVPSIRVWRTIISIGCF
ncbi:hypothetical protein SAMN06265784_110189 [Paraburkholderia susongensis]|uniref:Uncharacterized protein n=1 Tax=Paraburkholderia susongensis TaxID=1515439 RepID=A0A1X7LWI6_9BURK|nr:hypothetical protein SAMN06265784_110189 [Paraburkholderia susongensis]